jgi:hypothetical protein
MPVTLLFAVTNCEPTVGAVDLAILLPFCLFGIVPLFIVLLYQKGLTKANPFQ